MTSKDLEIKNFEIKAWKYHPCPMGTIEVPREFEAEIEGHATLEEIVKEVKSHLFGKKEHENSGWDWYWSAWSGDYVRIPYNDIVTEAENNDGDGVAAFVLTAELYGGTTGIKEGIYGIKKKGPKLKGRLITYDYTYFSGPNNPNYFRHHVYEIKDGILRYTDGRKSDDDKKEYKLNNL